MNTFYKALPLVALSALLLNTQAYSQQNCNNVGFEDSTFTNWLGFYGNPPNGCCDGLGQPIIPTPGLIYDRHTITSGTGTDPLVPEIPVVSPYGGAHSVRLGNSITGFEAEKLTYDMLVTTANSNFTYQYAVILQDGGHIGNEQPKFQINVSQQGQSVPGGFYSVVANSTIPGFQNGINEIKFKPWSLVALDLSPYIGQQISVQFQTTDCALGGHFGYAYVDASCTPFAIECDYCFGDNSSAMMAPPGFRTYLWSTGETTDNIVVNNPVPGDTVTVTCQPFHNMAPTILQYIFPQSVPFEANFTVTTNCTSTSATLLDSSTLINPNTQLTNWEWKVNGATISTQQQPVYDFTQAGTYDVEVVVKDAQGCADTNSRQIIIPEPMLVSPSVTTSTVYNGYGVSCGSATDGTAQVTIDNGELPYTFDWDISNAPNADAVANLAAGTYTVTVTDDAGCEVIATVQLTTPPAITASPVTQQVLCYGENTGSINLNANGGAGALNYTWAHDAQLTSSTINNLAVGSYAYEITDANGCAITGSAAVTTTATAITTNPVTQNILCYGDATGSISLNASGGAGALVPVWGHDAQLNAETAQNLAAGTYNVTITDADGCTANASISITQPVMDYSLSYATVSASAFGACDGGISISVTGNTPPYTYSWSTTPPQNSATATALCAGSYTVTVYDENNCSTTATYTVVQPIETGITKVNELSGISVWPNPHKQAIGLNNVPKGIYTVEVVNAVGQVLSHQQAVQPDQGGNMQLNIQAHPAGLYFIKVTNGTSTITLQAVKE